MTFLIDIIFNNVRYKCLSIAILNRNLKEYVDCRRVDLQPGGGVHPP
jgi:hypothetical protein